VFPPSRLYNGGRSSISCHSRMLGEDSVAPGGWLVRSTRLSNVGVVGAGTQGSQIAFRCVLAGRETCLYDVSRAQLDQALHKVRRWLDEQVGEGKSAPEEAESSWAELNPCDTLSECVATADIVIEAVPEMLELKQAVWAQIDGLAPAKTVLATNSSSLRSSVIGRDVRRKDKTFNLNFGQPAEDDHVEVMWNAHTSAETKEAALAFLDSLGFIPLVTHKEISGFSLNRIWRVVKKEALSLVDQSYCDFQDVDRGAILVFGWSKGPFQLMDAIGLDVIRDIELAYYAESGDESDRPPKLLEDLVAKGHLGVKTGQGFYGYPHPEFEQPGWLRRKGKTRSS
jgi:3-hydroxybutyryl-CoA dehydrogenase